MSDDDWTLFDVDIVPVLPYGGTSGWSGSATSAERAFDADHGQATTDRQREVLIRLDQAGANGLTWRDLADRTGWHHGQASSVLSVLHKAGLIARLTERRDRCEVYVTLDRVQGRARSEYRPNVSARLLVEVLTELEADLADGASGLALARVRATLDVFR